MEVSCAELCTNLPALPELLGAEGDVKGSSESSVLWAEVVSADLKCSLGKHHQWLTWGAVRWCGGDGDHGLWSICSKAERAVAEEAKGKGSNTALPMVAVLSLAAQAKLCLLRSTAASGEQQCCSSTKSVLKGEVCMIKMRMWQSRTVRARDKVTCRVRVHLWGENYKLCCIRYLLPKTNHGDYRNRGRDGFSHRWDMSHRSGAAKLPEIKIWKEPPLVSK